LSTGFCHAASSAEPCSQIFYAQAPQKMAVYIAAHGNETKLKLIAERLFSDITKAPFDLQRTKEIVFTTCAEKANETPQKFCLIDLFTPQHRIRSSYDTKPLNEYEPFDPYEWTVMLIYPQGKNFLTHFLDCQKLRPEPAIMPSVTARDRAAEDIQ
jgi:hypothetical protein